ncbi:hypothetical protein [Fructobacillus evanidus]|uniref:Uncharacterized protein n=1 Tax=Fructobacillus evanidus TaxID=3064281 RepID=A0ABN9YSQ6_9LACO|nr:hypothetical protein R55250_KEHBDPNM_00825 [Fructobacillus sp. LMG 32999]CAK1234599.1 hypothetical protein R53718_MFFEMHAI_00880 [Fructobacillus sp. LMG 32999]CAK1235998.1 hypothetical protein R55214_HHFBAMCI_00584 [Fructobacillus sp. LMG 32999]CAK1236424.1 hypothetical protein R55234_GCHJJDIB_00546 [Fructobacillus sp. LMG 32999]CAK1237315.1 hypothetical protein R53534_HOPDCFKK_00645 [Fructobacillus sp. LMG 32999]
MKHIKIIAGVTAAAVVVGGSLAYADGHSGHAQHKNSTDQAKVVKVKDGQTTSSNGSSSTDSSSGSDSDSSKKIELVKQAIINHGFAITPKTYNGLGIDQAMDQPGAPQDLVHDYVQMLYFTDGNAVRTTGLGTYIGETTEHYSVTSQTLNLELPSNVQYKIPYHIDHGTVVFDSWNQSFDNQNTFNFELTSNPDAKSLIDSKPMQDGHDTGNTNTNNNSSSDNSNSSDSDNNNSSATDSNNSDNNVSNSNDNNDSNNGNSDDSNDSNTGQSTDDNNSNSDNNSTSNSDSSQSSSSSDDDTNNN